MELNLYGTVIKLKKGDITDEECEVIVNAANSGLMGGGGVDGAIHRKAGIKLHEECLKIRREKYPDGLPTGEAIITTGGNLKAKFVIHTVGPVWNGGNFKESELLKNCFINSLKLAEDNKLKSIAFPAISTGIYGYPMDKAAETSIQSIMNYLEKNPGKFDEICFVLFTGDAYEEFEKVIKKIMK